MSNKVNLTKWLPKQHNDRLKLFQESRALVRNLRALGKKFATEINVDLPDYYVSLLCFNEKFSCPVKKKVKRGRIACKSLKYLL